MDSTDDGDNNRPLDKVWESFVAAEDLLEVLEKFDTLKQRLELSSLCGLKLFEVLKLKLGTKKTWKAKDVLDLLDKRAKQKEFMNQKAASNVKVFIVGSGPVGLRLAIDASLLGSEVVVIEKRNSYSRHNVLHLWPFTIEDLRQLGAKKFYGKFCAGAIDHISIWRLQSILLKLCLLLGVRVYPNVEFLQVLEPDDELGWHASLNPSNHFLNGYEFDVLVGSDGARKNRIPGFDRKELRGKLALAITANFKNYLTREEAAVEEISGVAFIFNQKFFKDLKKETGIDLENIVYYKDDTHYFVMTAKKDSLLKKGVLRSDYPDTSQLLHPSNINMDQLYDYSTEAADWSTDLPRLDFAKNHHDKPDVALFDFTSIHQAEYAARAIHRGGHDLFICLAGDALLEPFWPTGTGVGRGFLSAMDTAWLIRGLGTGRTTLDLLCERETIFQRLPQTTPEKLYPNIKKYTIDPQTRYPNLTFHRVRPKTIKHLYDIGTTQDSPALRPGSIKVKRTADAAGISSGPPQISGTAAAVSPLTQSISKGQDKENVSESKKTKEDSLLSTPKRRALTDKSSVSLAYYAEPEETRTLKDPHVLQSWCQEQVKGYGIKITDLSKSWSSGMALCALIHRYHPELIQFSKLSPKESIENNRLAFSVAAEHLGINSLLKPEEMARPDKLALFTYLSLFYELFVNAEPADEMAMDTTTPTDSMTPPPSSGDSSRESSPMTEGELETSGGRGSGKKPRKGSLARLSRRLFRRRTSKRLLATSPPSTERTWNTKSVKRPTPPPMSPTRGTSPLASPTTFSTPPTSPTTLTPVPEVPTPTPVTKAPPKSQQPVTPRTSRANQFKPQSGNSSDFCYFCNKRVYLMERMSANDCFFHRTCFRCSHCNCQLKIGSYALSKGEGREKGKFFCSAHYRQLFLSNPEAIGYQRADAIKRDSRSSSSEPMEPSQVATPTPMETTPTFTPAVILRDPDDEVFEHIEILKEDKKSEAVKEDKKPEAVKEDKKSEAVKEDKKSEAVKEDKKEKEDKKKSKESKKRSDSKSQGSKSDSDEKEDKKKKKKESKKQKKSTETSDEDTHKEPTQPVSKEQQVKPASCSQTVSLVEPASRAQTASLVEPASRTRATSLVKTLSHGFEQLEKHAKETEIQSGVEGREKGKQLLLREQNAPQQPYKLEVINEDTTTEVVHRRSHRERSPAMWRGSVTSPRGSRQSLGEETTGYSPRRRGRGQKSVIRPLIGNYDTSDVAIMERRKQQQRFRQAQLIQREMSQLERQYDELEVVGREIEEALRDAENTSQEEGFMKSWLNLVNERNGLVRKTAELSLKMKELELEDRQHEVDKELGDLSTAGQLTRAEEKRFEELCELKIKIVEERNEIVMQTEDERMRELEEIGFEDNVANGCNDGYVIISGDDVMKARRPSAPARVQDVDKVEEILEKSKKKSRVKSWLGFN